MSDNAGNILIIEDEEIFARALRKHLEKKGYRCTVCDHIADVEPAMAREWPQMILSDIRLPDGSGLELMEKMAAAAAALPPVIVMSAYGDMDDVISALRTGAGDFLKKPFDLKELDARMAKVLQQSKLRRNLDYSAARARKPGKAGKESGLADMVGDSKAISELREQIKGIADIVSTSEVPPTVLLTGETGTGKGLAARMLHAISKRAKKPFVQIDCASLPANVIEAELFGHTKGAFTDAHASRTGLIEASEDGVMFMDEISEMPLSLQTKLLAVLDRRMLRPLGTSSEIPVRSWFMAASNRELQAMTTGPDVTFRPDLYYRLNVLSINMPALRERPEDLMPLAQHFANAVCKRYGFTAQFAKDAEDAIHSWHWPGNVRELSHAIERAALLGKGTIAASNLATGPETAATAPQAPASAAATDELPPPPAAAGKPRRKTTKK